MNSTINEECLFDEFQTMEFKNTPRVWMFFGLIDGIWVLLPIAIFGTIVNGFLVSQGFA